MSQYVPSITEDCNEYDHLPSSYSGTISVTKSGIECRSWAEQCLTSVSEVQFLVVKYGLGRHNYCRNPPKAYAFSGNVFSSNTFFIATLNLFMETYKNAGLFFYTMKITYLIISRWHKNLQIFFFWANKHFFLSNHSRNRPQT